MGYFLCLPGEEKASNQVLDQTNDCTCIGEDIHQSCGSIGVNPSDATLLHYLHIAIDSTRVVLSFVEHQLIPPHALECLDGEKFADSSLMKEGSSLGTYDLLKVSIYFMRYQAIFYDKLTK
ncbi:unnamed protein product [Protopolystoma xenopodis]|uniref:Uncharacterized protein n=1 Tax=Protopolystoma xenopodis TaxID=117903 RepID=A0A3S5CNJ6_9PLAT|nr:unnamed protein product [Protopolystoma xenopodis]